MAATVITSTFQNRHHTLNLLGLILFLRNSLHCAVLFILISSSFLIAAQVDYGDMQNDYEICKSVDIRNSLESFKKLEGCRVVEGFVHILLFDNVNETSISKISFPKLTEITDYLLLYRVNGLRSIGQLFPNLAVIRGQTTFYNYAFIVFEMSSLQEIALHSLTDITHGLIRIDKNPSLCFVNSIDWDRIAHEKGEHFIKSLKPENECPICPGDEKLKDDESSNSLTISACPKSTYKSNTDHIQRDRRLCWNRQYCQKVCPEHCRSCNEKGECCNNMCLGGCKNEDINSCTVCRNFSIGFGDSRTCASQCPENYYEYLERRCVKRDECIRMVTSLELHSTIDSSPKSYKIFNNSCVLNCPANYMDADNHTVCMPCEGNCRKECNGVNVDSITLAKQLRGCTIIKGSLEIQIRGGRNVVNELEENLSMIEEITGYLKVVRSFPLVSLNFLKSLKIIHGNNLESQKYVFVVLDNQNLQDLWDWENRTLKLVKGRLFFHFNPKLCIKKIEMLQQKANIYNVTDLEVASNSNGDKIACDVENLEVTVHSIGSKGVILQWQQFMMEDPRKLLGYIVYSIEAQHQNVTLYDGRDACGGDGWRVDDVAIPDENSTLTHPLTQLKPYTQYAFYVKTYTIATERRGAQSKIKYFRTLPSIPSVPQSLDVLSNSSDSLTFSWQPPLNPSGNVTYYIVAGKKHRSAIIDNLKERDYCSVPPYTQNVPKHQIVYNNPQIISNNGNNNDTCSCESNKQASININEAEEISRIKFEDELQNEVYIKKEIEPARRKRNTQTSGDRKREMEYFPTPNDNQAQYANQNEIKNVTENGTNIWESFSFKVYGKTEFYLINLHHYTWYDIYVQACREKEGPDDRESTCSGTSIKTVRTEMKEGADDIKKVTITNQSIEMVSVTWDEPSDPNGMIFSYSIEYKRLDHENSKPIVECISQSLFQNQSKIHTVRKLSPGNYSLRVMATSPANSGKYSPYVYFHIKETTSDTMLIGIVVSAILCLVLSIVSFLCYRRHKPDKENMRLIPSINPEYVPSTYVPDDWEVPRKNVELRKELGQGSFGMVYEGLARDSKGKATKCAIKTVNEHATNRERLEFLNEASVMKAFNTTHVVRLIGVVSQGQPTFVIMELMANGDLKSYLRSHRPDAENFDPTSPKQPPTLKQILKMAIEIADGMAYLSAKKFVHRDLAARNCMVAEDLTVKIGDFGMTRDIYETDYYRKGTKGLLPVRWMAPESLKDGLFSSLSDVWSYGVVLWEMATLASQPYQGLSNDQVLRYVIDGGIMERPENCPDQLYKLMSLCWSRKAQDRPSFLKLCEELLPDTHTSFAEVSFYHSLAGIEARASRPTPSPSQDDPSTPLRLAGDSDDNFSLNSEDSESNLTFNSDSHIKFPSIATDGKDCLNTVNGYIVGCPTNGAATTQC